MAETLAATKEQLAALSDEELTQEFTEQSERVKTLESEPSNSIKLQLYGFFKQAEKGNNEASQPGIWDPRGRAKWNAWAEKQDLSTRDAQTEYIVLVKNLFHEIEEKEEET
ncbi:acyl-CoA-binding protein (ACBP)/diazepam binding inhibitor (DBI)/endozepine (EP) [Coemansia sp. RSA 2399]|nr:acyl-CoA-binding protein (ACBP)/diazepam binding inhibitor (DBI)/endozepine (EP) [Coemansia sp. RSA 2399]KAJ1900321.1 acyl-CoA-binding protein (ACBP)/diazepam binding inhibitor (DBI)/endozepine (EP) [Coemansia sp. IMI 209127]